MLPHQGGWSMSEAILTAGQATADNLPAGLAEIQYMLRVPTIAMAEQVTVVLDRNAEAAAAMTGCRWERHWVCKSRPGLANHAIARTTWEAMQAVGAPVWGEAAKAGGREIQSNLGLKPMDEPFIAEMTPLIVPREGRSDPAPRPAAVADAFHLRRLHRHVLACPHRPLLCGASRPSRSRGYAYPAWVMNALGGIPATIDPMVQTAAKILALSALAPAGGSRRPTSLHGRIPREDRGRRRWQCLACAAMRL